MLGVIGFLFSIQGTRPTADRRGLRKGGHWAAHSAFDTLLVS